MHNNSSQRHLSSDSQLDVDTVITSNRRLRALSEPLVGNGPKQARKIPLLSDKSLELLQSQRKEMEAVERLQSRLEEGERALGGLLKESLQLSRAIQKRREQNKLDKEQLDVAKARAQAITNELASVLHEMRDVSNSS